MPNPRPNWWCVLLAGAAINTLACLPQATAQTPSPCNGVSGCFTEFPIPTAGSQPSGITVGPDGALWFTETSGNNIGRITTAGVVKEFPIRTAYSSPSGITAGPDGALWFTETSGNNIGRITTAGVITNEFPIPTAASGPSGITTGPDGALWFTEAGGNKIGRLASPTLKVHGVTYTFPIFGQLNPNDYANDATTLEAAFDINATILQHAGINPALLKSNPLLALNELIAYDQQIVPQVDPYRTASGVKLDSAYACLAAVYTMIVQGIANQQHSSGGPSVSFTIGQFLDWHTSPSNPSFGDAIKPQDVYPRGATHTLTSDSQIDLKALEAVNVDTLTSISGVTFETFKAALTRGPVVIGTSTTAAQPHFLLATGTYTDTATKFNYVLATDPLFGLQVLTDYLKHNIAYAFDSTHQVWIPFSNSAAIEQLAVAQGNIVNESLVLSGNYSVLKNLQITDYAVERSIEPMNSTERFHRLDT
jgi:hypothetical protein